MSTPVTVSVIHAPCSNLRITTVTSTPEAEDERQAMHRQRGVNLVRHAIAPAPPELEHTRLREREGHEHVDGVHRHQRVDGAPRIKQAGDGRGADHQHAVVSGQPVGKRTEPAWNPTVERHVRHHARAADVAGLRRKDEQARLAAESDPGKPLAPVELVHQQAVHGAVLDRLQVGEEVAQDQAAGGDGQRHGHVEHGALGVRHLRLAHGRDAVGDGLDTGVGTGTA